MHIAVDYSGDFELNIQVIGSSKSHTVSLPGGYSQNQKRTLCAMLGIVAAQAILAETVSLPFRFLPGEFAAIQELGQLLYDAHAYRQGLDPVSCTLSMKNKGSLQDNQGVFEERSAVLLWSGGKDAVASLAALRSNGYTVRGFHATANQSTLVEETQAAASLAQKLDLDLTTLELDLAWLDDLLAEHSTTHNKFPGTNRIPHGRDLFLTVLAAATMQRESRFACVAAGFEFDLYEKSIDWQGRTVWRHDAQSKQAVRLLNSLVQSTMGFQFFSPISAFSERRVFACVEHVLPGAWQELQSCFWTRWCGECSKCFRYALTEASLGHRTIPFKTDPLRSDSPTLLGALDSLLSENATYREHQLYSLFADDQLLGSTGSLYHCSDLPVVSALRSVYDENATAIARHVNDTHANPDCPSPWQWQLPT
jgi:7-cyano-7-deazaguanine synthase in queuosine biosynthesis